MSDTRDPLRPLSANTSSTQSLRPPPKALAPLFTRTPRPRVSASDFPPSSSSSHHVSPRDQHDTSEEEGTRKRARVSLPSPKGAALDIFAPDENRPPVSLTDNDLHELSTADGHRRHARISSIHKYFPATPLRSEAYDVKWLKTRGEDDRPVTPRRPLEELGVPWRRRRGRLGISGARGETLLDMSRQRAVAPQLPFLQTLVTSIAPYHPSIPPSTLLLPSLHSPTGRPRDFAPALCVAFNNIAKQYDCDTAKQSGNRRLLAIAGEEGGVRIVDVDEGLGSHREEKGFWWRAHSNAVFDVKWAGDDQKLLTASGDQTTRIHALSSPTPTLVATLRGHTSSIKTAVFFDPSRSHSDSGIPSDIVASGGRDGNILIYDLRCRGRMMREGSDASFSSPGSSPTAGRSRERYSAGVPGFAAQQSGKLLDPVMVIRSAHGHGPKRLTPVRTAVRSVTSLLPLQSMPGVLASGGSFDGIVKLWDLRFSGSSTCSPDPRPTCTPFGVLPDPTINGDVPSRRARSINALAESPTSGDLYALCGDSKIHVLRPSASTSPEEDWSPEAIQPKMYSDPKLRISSFYIRLAISPDGNNLASGSCRGGVMTWNVNGRGGGCDEVQATRFKMGMGGTAWPVGREREVSAVDWGKDMLAACADDLATRVWRSNKDAAGWINTDSLGQGADWLGAV